MLSRRPLLLTFVAAIAGSGCGPSAEKVEAAHVLAAIDALRDSNAPADQRLTAKGDAQFRDDSRTGTGDTIRYDGTRVTLEGTGGRLATLRSNRVGVNTEQSTRARKFVYNSKTKLVEVSETSGGTFSGR